MTDLQKRLEAICRLNNYAFAGEHRHCLELGAKVALEIDQAAPVATDHSVLHEMLETILKAMDRVSAPPVFMMAADKAGKAFISATTTEAQHPAPIPTGWQPIETAPKDGLHVRGVVVCSANGIPLHFECHTGYVDEDGDFIDTAGDWHGWSAGDYTHWHPLEVPPAPGGKQ